MKACLLQSGAGIAGLHMAELLVRNPEPHEIRVQMKSAALNSRDLSFARGQFPNPAAHPIVPLADGYGVVIAAGQEVSRFKTGDCVITSYYPFWTDGAITAEKTAGSFGAQFNGTLAEEIVADANHFVMAPRGLTSAAAATLSCAGLTAWNALFVAGNAPPGARVLLLGTGGVSTWALQLAKAAGMYAIVTSSQDEKLERSRALGADATINYRNHPDWQNEVLRITDGAGVDLVVEVGGEGTLARSLKSAAIGGTVVVVGRVTGGGAVAIEPGMLIGGAKRLTGITAGSRQMLEDLVRFVDINRINPVIDKVFSIDQARAAYEYMATSKHFGKIVIQISA
ncbi:zinc-dependent alcohol dehydrogenase family protein [Herbaspirillum autotrophicum]|uniref:zinc-dependent alcohol dehydrogenase family protein n=1 Tax=Herbaspirillum autotrophicum TaxID=180195 RepID=UPI00067CDE96|nr:NAD(P)-dependent alcohol dehydrogenase [Herbaspirillum autotrophicum]